MSSPDRADIRPNIQHTSWVPHGLRMPALSSRLFLATLVGSAGTLSLQEVSAEAAGPNCRVGVRIESYTFFDMAQVVPELGRRHILDMGVDPRAGAAAGFTIDAVPITYKKGDRSKPDYRPLASTNIVRDGNVGRGEFQFSAPCNTEAVTSEGKKAPALRFKVVSSLHPDNDQFEVVAPDGRRSIVAFGREIKKPEDFLKIVVSGTPVQDLDEKKKELIAQALQKQTVQPTATSLPVAATPTPTSAPVPEIGKISGSPGIFEVPVIGGVARGMGGGVGWVRDRVGDAGNIAGAIRQRVGI